MPVLYFGYGSRPPIGTIVAQIQSPAPNAPHFPGYHSDTHCSQANAAQQAVVKLNNVARRMRGGITT